MITNRKTNLLMEVYRIHDKNFITSHKFHADIQPTDSVSATNKVIRSAKTYTKLINDNNILEANWEIAKNTRNSLLASLVKSNSYNPVMLIDPTAQKSLERHFRATCGEALVSSTENAVLALAGINIGLNKKALKIVKAVSAKDQDVSLPSSLKFADIIVSNLKSIYETLGIPNNIAIEAIYSFLSNNLSLEIRPNAGSRVRTKWVIPRELGNFISNRYSTTYVTATKVNKLLVQAGLQVDTGKKGFDRFKPTAKAHGLVFKKSFQETENNSINYRVTWDRNRTAEILSEYI